jgi:hypothetical protein
LSTRDLNYSNILKKSYEISVKTFYLNTFISFRIIMRLTPISSLKIGDNIKFKRSNGTIQIGSIFRINENSVDVNWVHNKLVLCKTVQASNIFFFSNNSWLRTFCSIIRNKVSPKIVLLFFLVFIFTNRMCNNYLNLLNSEKEWNQHVFIYRFFFSRKKMQLKTLLIHFNKFMNFNKV